MDRHEFVVGGVSHPMEPQVFALLDYLIRNRDRVVSKDDIINAVWKGRIVSDEALSSRISTARKAVGDDGHAQSVIRTVPRRGFRFIADVEVLEADRDEAGGGVDGTSSSTAPRPVDKPSIVVPPFINMSDNTEQEYFADGIAEDIITALSRFHWFFVISRSTSVTYRGIDTERVAQELGVHYVLEGSVRRSGARVRITAQLIDTRMNHHVWAERYDRDLEDIFTVQDEITERIMASVAPGIIAAEMRRARSKDIASLDAWDRVMRAHWHLARFTMEDNAEARRLLTEAAQIEPDSAIAFGDLAMINIFDGQWGWGISRDQSLAAAAEAARRAVTIDEDNTWAHIALALVDLFAGRHGESMRRLERAIEISPNDPHAHGYLGFTLSFSGEPQAAMTHLETATRLSPRDPFLGFWYSARGLAAFSAEHYEDCVEWAKKTIEEKPRHPGAYRLLAASCARLGRTGEATAALEQMLRLMPGITITATRQQVPWKQPDDARRYLDGLRKAGLPE